MYLVGKKDCSGEVKKKNVNYCPLASRHCKWQDGVHSEENEEET